MRFSTGNRLLTNNLGVRKTLVFGTHSGRGFCAAARPDVVRRRTTKCTRATLTEGDVPFWYERNRRRDEPKSINIGVPLQNGDQKSPKLGTQRDIGGRCYSGPFHS